MGVPVGSRPRPQRSRDTGPLALQELFSKQKGYLDEELDFRKQALDQAHKVRDRWLGVPAGAERGLDTGKAGPTPVGPDHRPRPGRARAL